MTFLLWLKLEAMRGLAGRKQWVEDEYARREEALLPNTLTS